MAFVVAGSPIGVTLRQFCNRVLEEYLERGERRELDKLSGAIDALVDDIVTTYGAGAARAGTRIEIDDELMHVWVATDDTHMTVERGHGGSTAAAHADGATVRFNPRFPRQVIAEQLRREIRSFPDQVYVPVVGEFTVGTTVEAIDLDGLLGYEVCRVGAIRSTHHDAADNSWPLINGVVAGHADETLFPSGYSLRFPGGRWAGDVRISLGVRHPTTIVALDFDDDIGETFMLTARQADAAMLGVAGTLLFTDEVERTQDQAQLRPRRGEDVPPGHRLQAGTALRQERDRLLKLEAERLQAIIPVTF
jgi:hypothetical protein